METPATKRLLRDFKKLQKEGLQVSTGCLKTTIPDDSPWEGGTFKLTLQFSEDYPNKPPEVRFVCRMFHPNIYTDGRICLDILQNQWMMYQLFSLPSRLALFLTIIPILLQSLLCDPNPNSPANAEAAKMFTENKREYNRRVKEMVGTED
ncbi:hypothetical protein V6N13_029367 [Hibiscus sabdariffa]|uniref:UBC core domain-containing protein n=1 Tax=Hibiscus sabdariffa TaxID=183260 RepID=A0ABR2TAM0_9ROSI